MAKSMKPGGGGRFAAMKKKLAGKVADPGAVAAKIGREKYGKKGMAKMAAKGRHRAAMKRHHEKDEKPKKEGGMMEPMSDREFGVR